MGNIDNVVEYKRKDDQEWRFFCVCKNYAEALKMFEKVKSITGIIKLRIRIVVTQQEVAVEWKREDEINGN